MKTSKIILISPLFLVASLLLWGVGAFAQQPTVEQPADRHQLSASDEAAIRDIIKDLETAWNRHDMRAFTKSFRNDAEGINVVGTYWRGKAAILKHLTDYHSGIFKNLQETLDEVTLHSIGDGYAIAVSTWKVGSFKAPNGVDVPPSRHRSTLALAKGTDGWKVVHFHNTIIDEAVAKGVTTPPKK
ncbi:MAG TPA: SgcJ/EcaC family oxidoreductase [Polyangia bacterium]